MQFEDFTGELDQEPAVSRFEPFTGDLDPVLPARREVPGMSVGTVAQDIVSGALQIGPTAVKGVADLARLATGDYLGKGLSDSMEEGIKSIQGSVGSERAAAQRENFQRDMADPNVSIGQALVNNKGALADQVLPTLGSMLLPVGAAGLAGKAATIGKTAAGLETAALASRVASAQQMAGIGATAAQNAADVFAGLVDKGYSLEDAYKAAGITVPFSVIAGKLTGGGAEVALARQAAGQTMKGGAVGVAKGAAREGIQEVGEELGQVTGEAVGTGITPDATNAGKRLAVAGTLGAVVGGGVDVAGHIGAKPEPTPAPRVEDQPTLPVAPEVPPAAQAEQVAATPQEAPGAPAVDGAAWSDAAAAYKRARAEAEVARKLSEIEGAPAATSQSNTQEIPAQPAPASELTAPVGDIARQVLAGEAQPPNAPPAQTAPTIEQAEQQLAAREAPAQASQVPVKQEARASAGAAPVQAPAVKETLTAQQTASWVIRNKETGQAVMETRDPKKVTALNTRKYEAIPVREHLASLSGSQQAQPAQQQQAKAPDDAAAQQRKDFAEAEKRRTAPGNRARARSYDANPFRAFLGKHGVATDVRTEFAPGVAEQRGAMVPGYGPIFRKKGKQLDALAQAAVEEGFLIEPDVAALHELIGRAMRGQRVIAQYAQGVAESEMEARIARQREMEEDAAFSAPQDSTAFEIDDADIPWDAPVSNMSTEAAMRDLGFTEEEIQDAIAQESRGTQEDGPSRGAPDEHSARAPQEGVDRGNAPPGPTVAPRHEGVAQAPGDLLGDSPNTSQQAAADERARRAQQEQQRRNAAPGPEGFSLGMEDARTGWEVDPGQGDLLMFSRRATDQTDTPAFKRWFGDSKVVDAESKPLVVYRYTKSEDDIAGGVRFFSKEADYAESYFEETGRGEGLTAAVYLNLRDPLVVDMSGREFSDPGAERPHIEKAMADGRDGVIFRSGVDEFYVAFRPEQIKSATGNSGRFDPANPDIRYSFAGQNASTADKLSLASAQQRIEAGEDAEAVRRATGWHQGADGKWRFEISDSLAHLKGEGTFGEVVFGRMKSLERAGERQNGDPVRLGDVLWHNPLFVAYPGLKNIEVEFTPRGTTAKGRLTQDGVIQVRQDLSGDEALSVLLHEVQHGIQDIEGFASGGPGGEMMWLGDMRPIAMAEYQKLIAEINRPMSLEEYARQAWGVDSVTDEIRQDYAQNFVPSHMAALERKGLDGDLQRTAGWRAYRRLAGEVEARNTQARQSMTDEQRRATPPSQTADVADADVIVTFNGKEMAHAPQPANASREMSVELAQALMSLRAPIRATKESVQAALDQLVPTGGRLPNGLGRIVVANASEIAPTWEPLIGQVDIASEDAGRAQGFYDPRTKTVFLIADHIRAGDEIAVAAHELMHKHGQAVLGAEGWNRLHSTIEQWADAPEGSTERQVYDEAVARVEASRPGDISIPEYTTQELFPYAVQVALEMGVQPSALKPISTVAGWLAHVRGALRRVWNKIANPKGDFNALDLVNLAFGIAQRENPAHRGELDNATQATAKPAAEPAQAPAAEPAPAAESAMYSRAKSEEAAPPPAEPAAAPAAPERETTPIPQESRARRFQRAMQDKLNRVTVLRNWAKENDIQLSSESDVWGYEARMHGSVATRVEDFREQTVKPLIERIQKAGYSMEQVAEFLHAKHAKERNAQIESLDPRIKDGSGMTNAEAQAIMAKAPEGLAPLAAEVQAITGSTRQILLDAGIISQEMAEAWDAAYKNYVPLKGGDEAKQGGTGKGLSVDGRQKRALGHGARDEKIVENILRDHERAIMLAEKNKVGQSLLVLVDELNNPDIATIGQPEKRRVLKQGSMFEARTADGIVVESFATQQQALNFAAAHPDMKLSVKKVTADPMVVSMASPMLGPNEVQVYLKGHAVRVQLNDELLSRAYQNLGPESFTTMMKINREVNAVLSRAYTGWNPEFVLTNIARDFTAGLTITTAKYGAGVAARAVKNYPKAMAQLLRFGFTKKASSSMIAYRLAGGSTGAAYLSDLQRIGEDVRATYDDARGIAATAKADGAWRGTRSAGRKALRFGVKYFEILNAAGESAMRLAVFEAMREAGHDTRESASAAKELLNFNRQGEATRTVGGWYLFLNASVQGTAAVADALVNGKHRAQGWALVGAMAALQYTLRSLQYADDDDDKKAWNRISEDTKAKNLIFRTGADSYAKMPLPYGLAAFYALGNAAYDIEHGEDIDKVALRVALTFADQFLPIKPYSETGDTRALVEAVPGVAGGELMRAALRAGVNRSGLGGDIVPDSKFDEGKPDNLKAYRSTRTSLYQDIATKLNAATGGTPTQAGLIDVSPESLKYWLKTLTGGAGSFFADSLSLLKLGKEALLNPDDPDRAALVPELSEIPVVRRFAGADRITDDRRQYWQAAKEITSAQQDNQRAKKAGDEEGMQRVEDKRGELLYFADALKRNNGHIKEIRDEVEEIMLDESTSLAFKRAAVKRLEAEESAIYREFVDMVTEDKAEAAKERASAGK